ncbi:MAG: SLBB domain-containing protein [Brucellaceae bacterium]|nr:SLBB domain-containing protein [Notoacmeibacter sp.]MCC0028655.1 SLBB domain-containing protein [Brucellaceae bacterium]
MTIPPIIRLLLTLAVLAVVSPAARADDNDPIRIGDTLALLLPGEATLTGDFAVDRKGAITLPEIGPVAVAGLPLEEAATLVRRKLSLAFRDIARLTMRLKERKLFVAVAGQVEKPGTQELPGDATVEVAIAEAGGIKAGAQLDKLKLIRGDREIVFNYKQYLDTGDLDILPALQPLDIVFVPISPLTGNVQIDFDAETLSRAGDGADAGGSVRIFGEVQKPAQFAFKDNMSLVDLIMRAGGVTRYAAVEQIRVITDKGPVLFNLQAYLDSGDASLMPALEPGATVFVPILADQIKRGKHTVYIMGEVAKPGAFEAQKGTTFIDILANAGGPTRFAETRQIRVIRAGGNVEMFDLVAFTEGKIAEIPLVQPGDAILVPEKTETQEPSWTRLPPTRSVQVMGAVTKPGRYEWADEMSLFDLIGHAGGPTAKGDLAAIQIVKRANGKAETEIFNMKAYLDNGGSEAAVPLIRAGYVVVVPELPVDPNDNKSLWVRQDADRSIYVMGAVGSPGRYAFDPSFGFLDILSAADGPTENADLRRIRVSLRGQGDADPIRVDLLRYMETGDERVLPHLQPGDMIYVPGHDRTWTEIETAETVRVLGAVAKPGRYTFTARMNILDLLAQAGGPTDSALQDRIVVVNMGKENKAFHFDLEAFSRTADTTRLPLVRPGDTVYVPDKTQSHWARVMSTVKDAAQIVALVAAVAAL